MKKSLVVKSLSYAFISNLISLVASSLVTLFLPKFLGVTQYSYYQLYLFYASYVGFFGIGCIEGIYLRHGGEYYENLNRHVLKTEFYIFLFFELIMSIIVGVIACSTPIASTIDKRIVFIAFSICIAIYLPRAWLHNLLQTVGRIKEYAIGTIIDKAVHIIITIILICIGSSNFYYFVFSELIGRICGGIYIIMTCKNVVFARDVPITVDNEIKTDLKEDVTAGLALMISNVAGMLVIGIVRQMIETAWDVGTFGRISLTLSLSNLFIIFINSASLVLFPVLKRVSLDSLKAIYIEVRKKIMIPLFGVMMLYLPARDALSLWLPEYKDSLEYMALLFPMCIFESKMSLLISTYFKALRMERKFLQINLISVVCSLVLGWISCFLIASLDLAVVNIVVILAIRSAYAEIILTKKFKIKVFQDLFWEFGLSTCFMASSWIIGGILGGLIYLIAYIVYLFCNRTALVELICMPFRRSK